MPMTAVHHYAVAGLWIATSEAGSEREFEYRGRRCVLRLPADGDDFDVAKHTPRGPRVISGQKWVNDGIAALQVLMVQVRVEMPGTLTAVDVAGHPGPEREADRILREAADIGRGLVSSLVQILRVEHGQSWLEPERARPRVTWLSRLLDPSGARVPVGYNDPLEAVLEPVILASGDVLDGVVERIANGDESLPLSDVLLADASFHAWRASHPNPHLGLVLAAIATEVKVKETLVRLASPDQRPVLDLVLENPRDWSVAAIALFDKALDAVAGRSLRTEDKPLYTAVKTLFEHRNRVAHRGDITLEQSLVRDDINAAIKVAGWLDGLAASTGEADS